MNIRTLPLVEQLRPDGIQLDEASAMVSGKAGRYLVPEVELVDGRDLAGAKVQGPATDGDGWREAWPWAGKEGGVLTYRWGKTEKLSPKTGSCLDEFLRLSRLPDDRVARGVLDFAKRWGPMEICEHGKPARHRRRGNPCAALPVGTGGRRSEPLEAWLRYSRHLEGILLVAANLLAQQRGKPDDWSKVEAAEPKGISPNEQDDWGPGSFAGRVQDERIVVALAVENWMRYGEVRSRPVWGSSRKPDYFALETISWGLVGRLARDLVAALESPGGVYRCAGCGRPFSSGDRRRASGRETWCGDQPCLDERNRRTVKRHYDKTRRTDRE